MKKNVYLLFEYIRSAGVSVLAVIVISALAMTGLTVSYGRIKAETEKYDKLCNSGLTEYYYGAKIKPEANLEEMIRAIDGVTEIIKRPNTVNFIPQNGPEELFSMKLYTEKHYESAALNLRGPGFDFGSNELECIIASDYFKNYAIGDTFSAKIPTKQEGQYITVDFIVKGIVRTPQSILSMSGGGSSMVASLLYEDASIIIIKDSEVIRSLIGDNITRSNVGTFFIQLDNARSADEQVNIVNEISKHLTLQSVNEILDNTKTQVIETISNFLPIILFCVLYSILTLVGMEVLISYKMSDEEAVWRCLGISQAKMTFIVVTDKLLIILISFVLGCILNSLIFRIPAVSDGIVYHAGLLLPALFLGLYEIITALGVSIIINKRISIKSMRERI